MENGAGLGTRLVLPSRQLYIFMCVIFNIKTMDFAFTSKNSQAVGKLCLPVKSYMWPKICLLNLLNKLSNIWLLCNLVIYCLTGTQEYNYRPESCCHLSISFIIIQLLHTHYVCSIDKSTDYSRNSTLTIATGYCNCTAVVS